MEQQYYYQYSDYLKNKYNEKVYKLPINLPLTCPNRIDSAGCTFCAEVGTGFEAHSSELPVKEQLARNRKLIAEKYHANKYIAYFQNYTNTFLPVEQFAIYLKEAAQTEGIAEISVSTRPDCINRQYLEVLERISAEYGCGISLELGLQTVNYHTLKKINRGHTLAEFIDAVLQIKQFQFTICTHVILNLPGDDLDDAVETAKVLSSLQIDIVKVHSLYIAKNTLLCDEYENGKITLCDKEEYIKRLICFLEHLNPEIAVERLFSRVPEKDSVFSNWGTSWWKLRDEVLTAMQKQGTWQGKQFNYLNGSALDKLEEAVDLGSK